MVELPSLREMLEAGVHFGHKTSRWHPKMKPYIFTAKSGVHVINLEETQEKLKEALDFLSKEAAQGKTIIFVGTKKQSSGIVKEAAENAGIPYVNERWLGGTITNFEAVKSATRKYKNQKEEAKDENNSISKSELSRLRKEVARGEKLFEGLINLEQKPEILVLFGSHDEKNALKEAKSQDIKTVAIVDTNADPTVVDYPIPANDDATKSVKLIADLISETIKAAKSSKKEASKEETK